VTEDYQMETNVEKIKKESKTGLTSSGLVDHILKNHKIDIHDVDSISLLNMGYYHGYKRYRFVKKANSGGMLSITSFKEIVAIYQFDMELKGLFYPIVMLVETALKNRTIDSLVAESSSGIEDVLDNQLACYIDYSGDTENMLRNSYSIMKQSKIYWIQLNITRTKMKS
jgi:abi family protein